MATFLIARLWDKGFPVPLRPLLCSLPRAHTASGTVWTAPAVGRASILLSVLIGQVEDPQASRVFSLPLRPATRQPCVESDCTLFVMVEFPNDPVWVPEPGARNSVQVPHRGGRSPIAGAVTLPRGVHSGRKLALEQN